MKTNTLFALLMFTVLSSCIHTSEKRLITGTEYRNLVHNEFLKQKEIAAGRSQVLFGVLENDLTEAERDGLEFQYAFMPLSDLAMNDGEYYLKQVKSALEAREYFSWGQHVPEDIFLHFVLPYRVNNEYTDTARQVFFRELKDRIKHMSMEDAALEVNHWCHEKVIYKSTDERTSGPLTTVRTAFGRCGEESTFTVAAMRSVGIPARQVYTPRWAHTDDNHAWVEVWIDGQWRFLGACEPEPKLDMGWFAEPVKRAMMTHTFVFGNYQGSEEMVETHARYARLNLLKNYTNVKSLSVSVKNEAGDPVADAKVEFGLYNYAEFYPVATLFTNYQGQCKVSTGYGDLLIHVSKGNTSASQMAAAADTSVEITLLPHPVFFTAGTYSFVPPVKQAIPAVDPAITAENNKRLLQEDSIRNTYISTFMDSVTAAKLAGNLSLNPSELWKYISLSRGNWKEIKLFVESLTAADQETGMALLGSISEKDLHDITAAVLSGHLNSFKKFSTAGELNKEDRHRYVLSPRIGREFVTPWRSFIQDHFDAQTASLFHGNPQEIVNWISKNIAYDSVNNYYGVPLSPEGMLQLRRADQYSRNLLFVAICRSFGVPARLEPATRKPQFLSQGDWKDVSFGKVSEATQTSKGKIILENLSEDASFIPRYYTHYTLARYEKGRFITLDYETDASLLKFPASVTVDTGQYRLITGNRLGSGEVICNISYFYLAPNQEVKAGIQPASGVEKSGIVGKANLNAVFRLIPGNEQAKPLNYQSGKGLVIALTDPSKEPTKHLMEDLKVAKPGLDNWGGALLIVVANGKLTTGFNPAIYTKLPENRIFGYDAEGEVAAAVKTVCSIDGEPQWPVLAIINQKGEITWYSEGYSIGLGDQLIRQLKEL